MDKDATFTFNKLGKDRSSKIEVPHSKGRARRGVDTQHQKTREAQAQGKAVRKKAMDSGKECTKIKINTQIFEIKDTLKRLKKIQRSRSKRSRNKRKKFQNCVQMKIMKK